MTKKWTPHPGLYVASPKSYFDFVDRSFKVVQWLFVLALLKSAYAATKSLVFLGMLGVLHFLFIGMIFNLIEHLSDRFLIVKQSQKTWLITFSIIVSVIISYSMNIAMQFAVYSLISQLAEMQQLRRSG